MGLSAQERAGGRRLLELLDTADLFSLAGTVTKKKSTAYTREDAIDTIIQYSQSAYELLNRRKVLRDIIAAYLKSEGVPLLSKFTKAEVIQKTLIYWNNLVSDSCKHFIPSSMTQRQEDSDADSSYPFYFHTLKSSTKSPLEDDSKTSNLDALTPWSFNNEMHLSSNFTTCKSTNKVNCVPYNFQNMGIMGLTGQQSAGSRKLLELLDTADLFSLASTVTMKKSTACTWAAAIDTIVQNSQSAYELLNRRKVLRDIIGAYLKYEGIPLRPKFTKAEVVLKTLTYWNDLDSCQPFAEASIPTSILQRRKALPSDVSHSYYSHTSKLSTYTPLKDGSNTSNLRALTTWSSDNELQFSSALPGFKNLERFRGMNPHERVGSRGLLELLDTTDLFCLAGTVTEKKSTVRTRAEAIDTIVQNSQSAYELLNRRKVLCDVIAAYLKKKGIPLPPRVTKAEVIQKTLMYWNNLDSCKSPSIMQQQESSAPDASHPFYFHSSKSSTYIPLEYAHKTAVKPLLEEVPAVMYSHNKDSVTSIIKQEMFSDVSVRPRHKVSSDVSSYTFPSDDSKLFTCSWQNKAREEQKSSSLECDPQYDVNHFGPSFKSPTYLLRVVGNTVIKGDKGYPQKSQSSSFVSEQHNKKVSQSPFVHQSARDKRESAEKVASLSSAIKDEEDN
ncbi:uncharacterized protein [Dendrobates tinctorius]|uniref:uncharacterized protein isoform X2 n=1 Tax=Dendrobates tinctorius TaxID=92724 RepID=UPI003CC94323